MTHRVVDMPALEDLPGRVRVEARARLHEIIDALEGIPAESAFWRSVQVSRLCLVVRGWCFYYTIDEDALHVIEVRRQ